MLFVREHDPELMGYRFRGSKGANCGPGGIGATDLAECYDDGVDLRESG